MKIKLTLLAALCIVISAQTNIGGQIKKAALENLAADPTTGSIPGRIYWNTTDDEVKIYDGSSYVGIGGNSFPLAAPDGDHPATPSYNFSSQTGTGLSLGGTNLSLVRQGVVEFEVTQNQSILGNFGDNLEPSLTFSGDENTGMFRSADDVLNFTTGGTEILELDGSGITVKNNYTIPVVDGTNGQILQTNGSGLVTWQSAAGFGDPMLAEGDIIYRTSGGTTTRLPKGDEDQVLTSGATSISWENAPAGFADPMSVSGDLIFKNGSDTTTRLPRGSNGHVLTATGSGIGWAAPTAVTEFPLNGSSGSVGTPTYSFSAAADTGMWYNTVSTNPALNFSVDGANYLRLTSDGLKIGTDVAGYTIPDTDGGTSGMVLTTDAAGVVSWALPPGFGGVTYPLTATNGTNLAPSYSFASDTTSGMHLTDGDELTLTLTEDPRIIVTTDSVLLGDDGLVSTPALGFMNDQDTGLYLEGAGILTTSTAGVKRLAISSSGLSVGTGLAGTGYQLPLTRGTAAQVLSTDSSGNVSWEDVTASGLSSTDANDINITPDTTGSVVIDGQSWPQALGSAGQILETDASGQLSWADAGSGGIAALVDDASPELGGDLDVLTRKITTSTANGGIIVEPNGTGAFQLSSGGDARGSNAVDLQITRTSATQVASGFSSSIIGGRNNTASNTDSLVVGGLGNAAGGSGSSITGGGNNTIGSSAGNATIGGGLNNQAFGSFGTIAGGTSNLAVQNYSTVVGGRGNRAGHEYAVAMGGGAYSTGDFDVVVGNQSTATPAFNNVHFRIAGDTSNVSVGRDRNQSAKVGAENKLQLHTVLASNQSRYTSFSAHATLTETYDLKLPDAQGADGDTLVNDSSGNLSWKNLNQLSLEGSAPTCTEGLTFYNTVSDYVCFCDATATPKQMHSPATSCF